MPLRSKSQNRLFRWADEHPEEAEREKGIKPKVTREFLASAHGQHLGNLPERVPHRARGGAVFPTPSEYPPRFRW